MDDDTAEETLADFLNRKARQTSDQQCPLQHLLQAQFPTFDLPAASKQQIWNMWLQRAPGSLDSPKPLSKPQCSLQKWPDFGWKHWIVINSPVCFIYWKNTTQMPPCPKEFSTSTSSTRLPLLHFFFFSQEPHSNHLDLLQDGAASNHTGTAQLTQRGADTMLQNGQKDEHHVNAWAILSALLGSCTHRST